MIAKTSFDDEEKESGAWNGNRNVGERSRNEAVALSGGGNAAEGLRWQDGIVEMGGRGQDSMGMKFFLSFSFLYQDKFKCWND